MKIDEIQNEGVERLKVGDQVTVDKKQLKRFPSQTMSIVKKIISNADGEPYVVVIKGKMAEIAETPTGIIGTVTVPIAVLTKIKSKN